MWRIFFICTCLIVITPAVAQNPLTDKLVYQVPGMKDVKVRSGVEYRKVNDTSLHFDIYYPKDYSTGNLLPLVMFNNGVGAMNMPEWNVYRDWSKLVAANGMIAITHQARTGGRALEDDEALTDYILAHSSELGIDKSKIALYTCSANSIAGARIAFKTRPQAFKVLVVYYGVIDSLGELRQNLPMLLVRTGMDMPGGNVAMERFIQEAYAQDIPIETINYPEGVHAFDIFQPGEKSEDIIKRTVKFFSDNLQRPARDPAFLITNRNFVWLMGHGQSDRAIAEFRKMAARCKTDSAYLFRYRQTIREQSINANAYSLLQNQKKQEALATFKLMVEYYPESANAYDGLADAYEALGNKEEAVNNAKKALAMLGTSKDLDPEFKKAIERSAQGKIGRLK